jgi:MtrB/PioB family decaheme-associated outer membrane protein
MGEKQGRKTMKKCIPMSMMLALLLPLSTHAQERQIEGELELTGKLADIDGSKAKFNEYRDIGDGIYGALRLWHDTDTFFFNFQAENISYEDQNYRLDGGGYGRYRFNLFYDEIPHNLTFDARTFYSGAGSERLSFSGDTPPSTDLADWTSFDYRIERRQRGAGLRLDMLNPFFIDMSYVREKREGIRPLGVAPGLTGGSSALELPKPVDYGTDYLKTEAGYARNPFFASLSYVYGKLENDNEDLSFRHPASEQHDLATLAPDNDYYKVAFRGSAKLPLRSALSVNAGRSVAESSARVPAFYLDTAGLPVEIALSQPVFNGRIVTKNAAAALTTSPIPLIDAKIFYKYYDKDNRSDEITFTTPAATFHNHLFGYKKNSYGAELGFRLPGDFRIAPAYRYVKTERDRGDLPETKDDIYSVDASWTGWDLLTVSAGYERLDRTADWQQLVVVTGSQITAEAIEPFVRRFDAASQDRDTYRASVDLFPIDNLTVGAGYRYIRSKYPETVLGLLDEKSNMFEISANYSFGIATFAGYFAYEKTEWQQLQRRLNFALTEANAGLADPARGFVDDNAFNWSLDEDLETYDFGISLELDIVPNTWRLRAQYDHVRSDGLADFTHFLADPTDGELDHRNWDDYRRNSFLIKAIYDVNVNLSTAVGYSYERFKYNDALIDGYRFTYPGGTPGPNYLTGAFRDLSYRANVVFTTVNYRF